MIDVARLHHSGLICKKLGSAQPIRHMHSGHDRERRERAEQQTVRDLLLPSSVSNFYAPPAVQTAAASSDACKPWTSMLAARSATCCQNGGKRSRRSGCLPPSSISAPPDEERRRMDGAGGRAAAAAAAIALGTAAARQVRAAQCGMPRNAGAPYQAAREGAGEGRGICAARGACTQAGRESGSAASPSPLRRGAQRTQRSAAQRHAHLRAGGAAGAHPISNGRRREASAHAQCNDVPQAAALPLLLPPAAATS